MTQAAAALASRSALGPGQPSDLITPSGSNLLQTGSFEMIDFQLTSNELTLSEHCYNERANITLRFPSGTVSPARFFSADWSLQHA